jgi:hypothetical protein
MVIPRTSIERVEADGVTVFYRQAGSADGPVLLLLHGFPASSFQFRELMPRLADRYRVIAHPAKQIGQNLAVFSCNLLPARTSKFVVDLWRNQALEGLLSFLPQEELWNSQV